MLAAVPLPSLDLPSYGRARFATGTSIGTLRCDGPMQPTSASSGSPVVELAVDAFSAPEWDCQLLGYAICLEPRLLEPR